MSLFQCDKCGCLENTALSGSYHIRHYFKKRPDGIHEHPAVVHSYRVILGLKDYEEFGAYCSACNPVWYTESGHYGSGPRPEGYEKTARNKDDTGVWHGQFERRFLPKNMFHTNEDGNLAHIVTLETDTSKYVLEAEDTVTPEPRVAHPDGRLPRPGSKAEAEHIAVMTKAAEMINAEDKPAEYKRAAIAVMVQQYVDGKVRVEREQADRADHRAAMKHHLAIPRQSGKKHAVASLAAMAGIAAGVALQDPAPRRPLPKERVLSEEEIAKAKQRDAACLAKAEEKRQRKAAKRMKHATVGQKPETSGV